MTYLVSIHTTSSRGLAGLPVKVVQIALICKKESFFIGQITIAFHTSRDERVLWPVA